MDEANAPPRRQWMMFCVGPCLDERLFEEATDEDGKLHHECTCCRSLGFRYTPPDTPSPSATPRGDIPQPPGRRNSARQPRPDMKERQRRARLDRMQQPDPTIDPSSATWATDPALTEDDYCLLNNFHGRMDKNILQTSTPCNERWFHMGLNGAHVCEVCIKVDKDMNPDDSAESYMFTHANLLDPG